MVCKSCQESRAHGQLGAERLRLKVGVDKELDDAGGVLLDHDLAPEAGLLVVGVQDAANLLDGVGNLDRSRNTVITILLLSSVMSFVLGLNL